MRSIYCYKLFMHVCAFTLIAGAKISIGADDKLKLFVLREGIRENKKEGPPGWVFTWDEIREVYDFTTKLGSSRSPELGSDLIPGLKEVGIKTETGLICEYGDQMRTPALLKFFENNPKEVGEFVIFEDALGERLELSVKKPNSICRVDMRFEGRTYCIWRLLTGKPTSVISSKNQK
jgi:hypothetical protein